MWISFMGTKYMQLILEENWTTPVQLVTTEISCVNICITCFISWNLHLNFMHRNLAECWINGFNVSKLTQRFYQKWRARFRPPGNSHNCNRWFACRTLKTAIGLLFTEPIVMLPLLCELPRLPFGIHIKIFTIHNLSQNIPVIMNPTLSKRAISHRKQNTKILILVYHPINGT